MTRYQTEMASEQSRSVMIFTIVTIIFLPLSFFSSVFGMNVSNWSGTPTNPSLDYVILVMATISLLVIVIALAAAFNVYLRRAMHRISRRFWHRIARPLWHLLARAPFKKLRRIASQKSEDPDVERGLIRSRRLSKSANMDGPVPCSNLTTAVSDELGSSGDGYAYGYVNEYGKGYGYGYGYGDAGVVDKKD